VGGGKKEEKKGAGDRVKGVDSVAGGPTGMCKGQWRWRVENEERRG